MSFATHGLRLFRGPRFLLIALGAAGCGDSFTEESAVPVTVTAVRGIPDTMMHADSDTVSVEAIDSLKRHLSRVVGNWHSSDESTVHVRPLGPDSLRAILTARAVGAVQITVSIDTGIGTLIRYDSLKTSITVLERWIAASAGRNHTCAVSVDSVAYCWGAGGLIGNGTAEVSARPVPVLGLEGLRVAEVSAGAAVSCARERGGLLYCWGQNDHGEAGNGSLNPLFRAALGGGNRLFSSVSVGGDFVCAIGGSNETFCWGAASLGQLGYGTNAALSGGGCGPASDIGPQDLEVQECSLEPTTRAIAFGFDISLDAISLSAGGAHSCVTIGRHVDLGFGPLGASVWCWGQASVGQLGAELDSIVAAVGGDTVCKVPDPEFNREVLCSMSAIPVKNSQKFNFVSAGKSHTCALTVDGLAYCWGRNDVGQLGTPNSDPTLCSYPVNFTLVDSLAKCRRTPVAVAPSRRFVAIGTGAAHSCALGAADGLAYCWGDNTSGQLGSGGTGGSRFQPSPITSQTPLRFSALTVGGNHACGLTPHGALYCWGRADEGQIGSGVVTGSLPPVRVAEPSP